MGLRQAIEKMGNALSDWSQLEVYTFTGDLKNALKAGTSEIDWENLGKKATEGTVTLIAATRINVDADTQQFQTSDELQHREEMLAAHKAALESALATRKALIEFFVKSVMEIVKL